MSDHFFDNATPSPTKPPRANAAPPTIAMPTSPSEIEDSIKPIIVWYSHY